jgi:hypothetical protein
MALVKHKNDYFTIQVYKKKKKINDILYITNLNY